MAYYGQQFPRKFPPQTQDKQPGQQYVMNPIPITTNPDYIPSNKLRGKVALVTGGDSGIGEAVCYSFALEGATVAFTYVPGREDKDASNTLHMLKQAKTAEAMDPICIPTDLGYEENCKEVIDEVVKHFGRIDILVNNAAVQYELYSIEDISAEQLERTFRINIFSQVYMVKHALKHMSGGSCIINTTSVTAYKGHPSIVDYAATKGAILGFTRSLALQLIPKGIRVNGVAPGPVWTPLQPASLTAEEVSTFGSGGENAVPMKRAGQPVEIAQSYVFLASNECSSYITGQVLHPNGGTIINA